MNKISAAILIAILYIFPYNNCSAQVFSEQSIVVGVDHTFQPRGLMGGGAAFFDCDQDGDEDLYLTGGTAGDDLYLNNGNGTFTKASSNSSGLEITKQFNTTAVITGDIDNDGDRDVFLSTWEINSSGEVDRSLLLLNKGDGTFEEVGESAGITEAAFTIGANFVDYNRDGWLDIHVLNHVESPAFLYDSTGVIVGFDHDCYANFFYRNNGDGTFSEVGDQLGINDGGCALASLASDYDMDGDQDIFIANDFGPFLVPNRLYQNNFPTDGFSDISETNGADIPMYGMGVAGGDYDQDLDLDYYITNLGANVLMENQGGSFVDVAATAQVESTNPPGASEFATGWGTAFFDIDNDTWLDLFVANGRIPSLSSLPTAFNDPNKLFLNNGDKTFADITDQNNVGDPSYSRGMAYADFDQDGDLDFVVVNQNESGGKTKFYRNDLDNGKHFVQFHLKGKESNRDAYGAKLWLYAGGKTFLRETDGGGGSFCSQSSSVVHLGLNDISSIDSLRIDWPNGHVDHLGTFEIDQRHEIEEGIINSGIADAALDLGFVVSPNPFEDRIVVEAPEDYSSVTVLRLLAIDGQVVWSKNTLLSKGSNAFMLGATLPAGIYTLQILVNDTWQIQKLVKH